MKEKQEVDSEGTYYVKINAFIRDAIKNDYLSESQLRDRLSELLSNPAKFTTKLKEGVLKKREKRLKRLRKYNNAFYKKSGDRIRLQEKERNKLRRIRVLEHYSGIPPKCACCGEARYEFLAIDHIKGGGQKHLEEIKVSPGGRFVGWIINNNFPPMFQILCHNCNMAKGFYGKCPHPEKVNQTV